MPTSLTPPNLTPFSGTLGGSDLLVAWPTGAGGPLCKLTYSQLATNLQTSYTGVFLLVANNLSDVPNDALARTNLGLGTASTADVGTSGNTVPILNAANTWGALQTTLLPNPGVEMTVYAGWNNSNTVGTGLVIDLNPTAVAMGLRSAQVVAKTTAVGKTKLVLRSSNALPPADGLTVNPDQTVTLNLYNGANAGMLYTDPTGLVTTLPYAGPSAPGSGLRETLTANRNYFVRLDGSDSNNGLTNTGGGAWLTLAHAYFMIQSLDFNGFTVTVQLGNGTYTAGLTVVQGGAWVGGGNLIFIGDIVTPGNVVIAPVSGDCFQVNCPLSGVLRLRGMRMAAGAGHGIAHYGGGFVNFSEIDFGTCSLYHVRSGANGGTITAVGSYSISGGATGHLFAQLQGAIITLNRACAIPAGVAFSGNFALAQNLGFIDAQGQTFTGVGVASVTGTRYAGNGNSVIYTNGGGANFFPGSIAGAVATGAQYL